MASDATLHLMVINFGVSSEDPGMLEGFGGAHTLLRLDLQQFAQKIFALFRHLLASQSIIIEQM